MRLAGRCHVLRLRGVVTNGPFKSFWHENVLLFGRGDRIRTCDIYVPNVALYQSELHPARRWARSLRFWRPRRQPGDQPAETAANPSTGTPPVLVLMSNCS